jgi:hypothetical protein
VWKNFTSLALLAACGAPGDGRTLDLAHDAASMQVTLENRSLTLRLVPAGSACPSMGPSLKTTFNGWSMSTDSTGGDASGKCAPILFSLSAAVGQPLPPGPSSAPTDGEFIVSDGANQWILEAPDLLAARTLAWSLPADGVVKTGGTAMLAYAPATDESPQSGQIQLVPLAVGDAGIWQALLTAQGGFETVTSTNRGFSNLRLESGFTWDSSQGTLTFAVPAFPTGPAAVTFNSGPLQVPIGRCSARGGCSASVCCGSAGSLAMTVVP